MTTHRVKGPSSVGGLFHFVWSGFGGKLFAFRYSASPGGGGSFAGDASLSMRPQAPKAPLRPRIRRNKAAQRNGPSRGLAEAVAVLATCAVRLRPVSQPHNSKNSGPRRLFLARQRSGPSAGRRAETANPLRGFSPGEESRSAGSEESTPIQLRCS
jgi:hypothetical protein